MKCALLALALLFGAAIGHAGEANVYLSWNAPHGEPRGTTRLDRAGGDTTKVDTLYLTFEPGEACSTLVGMTATLWFRALGEDSLSASWRAPRGNLPPVMSFQFGADSGRTSPFPWEPPGITVAVYTRPNSRVARLRVVFATSGDGNVIVEGGKRYSLGQILIRRPASRAEADRPLCVEWTDGTLAMGARGEPHVNQGVRFAGINAQPGELGCSVGGVGNKDRKGSGKARSTRR